MANDTIRLLMIDDNSMDVEIVRNMLRQYPRANFELQFMHSTEKALLALTEQTFDLLLLDYNLPGEDGLGFLKRLAGHPNVPPVIMLTGDGDERLAAEAMRNGAYDYFPKKSINSIILARAIHQALEKFQLDQQLESTERVIFTLAAAVEAKDPTTGEHLQHMSQYAVALGGSLGLGQHDLLLLRYGAILHDIGKVGVSEAILCKPGPLDDREWAEMHQHPVVGEQICSQLRFANVVGPIIRHHHERWDGRGYIDGLAGEDIPLLARIVSVVDAFDAMTSDRPYRAALPVSEALSRLRAGAGEQWDPGIVDVFVQSTDRTIRETEPAGVHGAV
ncbi:MAG: HD domain-containing phosphohydrolase [Dehalococcoidia bacterium]